MAAEAPALPDALDEPGPSLANGNGSAEERVHGLEAELAQTKRDRDGFEAQYRSLLGKLTTMRNTLGDKLKQDADELDRRAQAIHDLQATNEDLAFTVETLKTELIQAHEDSEHVHSELEALRLRAFDSHKSTSEEAMSREMALRDSQEDLERIRMEREEWEGEAMQERVRREELAQRLGVVELELAGCKTERELLRDERDREAESAANLHHVLEEFQAAKDRELKATLGDLQTQLRTSSQSLADYKQRATSAETHLTAVQNDSEKVLGLTKEVKDKNSIIGKLRHEAVILNEHLTESLRRLKKDSTENSVDRRLVSNVLITFLNTPRSDTKRFEMLNLISSILSWTDDQRERVGLQRSSGISAPGVVTSGSRTHRGHARSGKGKAVDDGLGENETFSALWIEFLLREVQGNGPPAPTTTVSNPTSPGSDRVPGLVDLPPLSDLPLRMPPRRPSLIGVLSGSNTPPPLPSPTRGAGGIAE